MRAVEKWMRASVNVCIYVNNNICMLHISPYFWYTLYAHTYANAYTHTHTYDSCDTSILLSCSFGCVYSIWIFAIQIASPAEKVRERFFGGQRELNVIQTKYNLTIGHQDVCQRQVPHAISYRELYHRKITTLMTTSVDGKQKQLLRHFIFLRSRPDSAATFAEFEMEECMEACAYTWLHEGRGREVGRRYMYYTKPSRRTFISRIMLKSYHWINSDMTYDPISSVKQKWLRFHFSIRFFGVFFSSFALSFFFCIRFFLSHVMSIFELYTSKSKRYWYI